jgi:hypothetical protein
MKKEKEIWVDSYYYPEKYEVSDQGRIRNKNTNSIRKPRINKKGYFRFDVVHNGKKTTILFHRLIYLSFNPNTPLDLHIHHLDNDKNNNKLCNLGAINGKIHNSMHSKIRLAMGTLKLIPHPGRGKDNHACMGFVIAICPNTLEVKYKMAGNYEMKNLGFHPSAVNKVIKGKLKQYKNFIFKKIPFNLNIEIGEIFDINKECLK